VARGRKPDARARRRQEEAQQRNAERVEGLQRQLETEVASLASEDGWRTWLKASATFHDYSLNNQLLIAKQMPEATRVAGYKTWQKLGRQVRKGEKAQIMILAPMVVKARAEEPGQPDPVDAQGNPVSRVVGFRGVPVWDISQTDGDPLPTRPDAPHLLAGQAPEGLWDALAEQVSAAGFTLHRGDPGGGANGVTRGADRTVIVRDDVDDAQAVKTLAHELAHVLLHFSDDSPVIDCVGTGEVEAESVAFIVCQANDMDTSSYTLPYVAGWAGATKDPDILAVVRGTAERVNRAARTILDTMAPQAPDEAVQAVSARITAAAQTIANGPVQRALDAAQEFYTSQPYPGSARTYLATHGIAAVTAQSEGVGYAPAGWRTLTAHLTDAGHDLEALKAAGLTAVSSRGTLIDVFRDRLTFPIRNPDGTLAGFSARALDAEAAAGRWINSKASETFDKGAMLYGAEAVTADTRTIFVTEGPADRLAIHEAIQRGEQALLARDTTAVVATCGTALTERHASWLASTGARIVVATDGDAGGETAAEAAWWRLTACGVTGAQKMNMPDGMDPAQLRAVDPERLAVLLWDRGRLVDQMIAAAAPEGTADRDPATRVAVLRTIAGRLTREDPATVADTLPVVSAATGHTVDQVAAAVLDATAAGPSGRPDGSGSAAPAPLPVVLDETPAPTVGAAHAR
jgi:DNA primase catalytic core